MIKEEFIIGDQWVFFKIFTGKNSADKILLDMLEPLINKLITEKVIKKWFFMRYGDPQFHIRLRFELLAKENLGELICQINPIIHSAMDAGLIWNVQLDKYQRELSRYGNNSIEFCEDLFFYDSEMNLKLIHLMNSNNEDMRWKFALKIIDNYLNLFEFDMTRKVNFLSAMRLAFGNEFGMSRQLKRQLDIKYRENYSDIESFFNLAKPSHSNFESLISEHNSKAITVCKSILQLKNNDRLEIPINQLLASLIHMSINRVFSSKNRLHEMVCYDFVYRYFKSISARLSKQSV